MIEPIYILLYRGFIMKFNKIILISLILIMLSLGAVSASQDIPDNATSSHDADIIADDDDDDEGFTEYDFGVGSQNPNIEVEWPSEIKVGDFYPISFTVPEDMKSNVALFIDNERVDSGQVAGSNTPYDVYIDEFGTHTLKFTFYGDNKYKWVSKQKTYNVNDYKFDVQIRDENITYGEETEVLIEFPFDATGSISVGGVKYVISDSDIDLTVPLKNLQMGTNRIAVTYSGDEKYPSKSVNVNVNVNPRIVYGERMPFSNVAFNLTLPGDAGGNLEVTVDGSIKKTAELKNGFAQVIFDGLALGGHTVSAKYTGSGYSCTIDEATHFEVTPYISVNSFKTTKDDNTVDIALPEGEIGLLEVNALRYLEEEGIVISETPKSFNVINGSSIDFSTLDYGFYRFEIKYTSKEGYFYSEFAEGYVRDDFDMSITVPGKVLADDEFIDVNVTYLMGSAGGYISFYVDGGFYDELECDGLGILTFTIEDGLSVGKHNVTVKFSGNERYSPLEKSAIVETTYLFFDIPEEIVIGVDDEISIRTVGNATGELAAYVDGKQFSRQVIEGGSASINMSSLPFKTYSVRVAYEKGNYPSTYQDCILKVSYTFAMSDETISYGNDDFYAIDLPQGLSTDKLVVKVDNEVYPLIANGNEVGINVSGMDMGSHVISVSHPGEGDFYPLEIEKTFEVAPLIDVPSQVSFGEDESISLVLPKNPKGKLVLYEYDSNYRYYAPVSSFSFTQYGNNSIAEIPISYLGLGEHKIMLSYSGDDYNVTDMVSRVCIDLNISYSRNVEYAKKSTVTVNVAYAMGSIDVYVDDDQVDVVEFVNGIAKIHFSDLEVGQHYFRLSYDDVFSFDYEGEFVVYPVMRVPSSVIDGDKSVTVESGFDPVGCVMAYVDGKFYRELDLWGDTESISLAGISAGSHRLMLVYDSWDELKYNRTYTINVKKASITAKDMSMNYLDGSKFKVLIKDYKGKAVKKGQSVKFYVDGKLFKTVKTDKKGYASVVLTHVPKVHSVKVVYKATTVTKKVTVKQILSLKKVAVKKSAKKLTLQATLKKVKGKYLKNKKITFRFNGKTYAAKTNNKGVAKVTIKSNVLKKLKAGKKVTYQATYVKATVKQSVKVSK